MSKSFSRTVPGSFCLAIYFFQLSYQINLWPNAILLPIISRPNFFNIWNEVADKLTNYGTGVNKLVHKSTVI